MAQWLTAARHHPSAVLLGAQLAGVVIYPFLGESAGGRALVSLFGLFVLVLAVWTIRTTPALLWVAVLLGVPVAVLTVLEALNPSNQLVLWSSVLHAAFYFYAAYGLLRYMFNDRTVTTDELFATGATFTVLAWAFAYLYAAIQVIWPGSFTAALAAGGPAHVDRAPLPVLHEPEQHRPLRRRSRPAPRAVGGDDRAGGRAGVHRDGGRPIGRAHPVASDQCVSRGGNQPRPVHLGLNIWSCWLAGVEHGQRRKGRVGDVSGPR